MQDPRRSGRILLLFPLLTTIFLDYWEYSKAFYRNPEDLDALVRGVGPAPQQYRIGVLRLAEFLSRHSPLGLRHGFTLIDLVSASIAVYVLFSLLAGSESFRTARQARQWLACGAYLFLVQLLFAWVLWYQRPETFTTAAAAALLLWLLTRRSEPSRAAGRVLVVVETLMVAVLQALVRADVVITLELGVFAMCLLNRAGGLALPRWMQAATSLAAVMIAGGVQFYIIHRLYPHASYGDTPVFQLRLNITDVMRWPPFFLTFAPYLWLLWVLARGRGIGATERRAGALETASIALVPGSVLFLGLFLLLGRMDEVRIFLPYALALAPLTALLIVGQVEGLAGE